MARYLLSAHTYVCVASEYAVFLDLRKDRYSALEPADALALCGVVEGWSAGTAPGVARERITTSSCEEGLVDALLEERLLTEDALNGKAAIPVPLDRAKT